MSTSWHERINMLQVIIFYDFEGLNLDKGLVAFTAITEIAFEMTSTRALVPAVNDT